jgi:hypothetical protein
MKDLIGNNRKVSKNSQSERHDSKDRNEEQALMGENNIHGTTSIVCC